MIEVLAREASTSGMGSGLNFLKCLPQCSALVKLCLQSPNDPPYSFSVLEGKPGPCGPTVLRDLPPLLFWGLSIPSLQHHRRFLSAAPFPSLLSRNRLGLSVRMGSDHFERVCPNRRDLAWILVAILSCADPPSRFR